MVGHTRSKELVIYVFFLGHWIASVFFQSFFSTATRAHRM